MKKRIKIADITLCAVFAALTAVLSQAAIPIGPVPINLATFAVFCAGALLGSKRGALSLLLYTVLGIAGLPVFSMFRGGVGVIAGPTGGFIIGYTLAAFLIGYILERQTVRLKRTAAAEGDVSPISRKWYAVAMLAGAVAYFFLGSVWYMFLTGNGLWETLTVCVVPFIPGDLLKIAAATAVCKRLRGAI
ncbi:MAG: biotin transporter BioY [Clostridiales bacterium]|nr:biotin transporter BioY [Clostridiales bacterium]